MSKKILITGGAGFIGSHATELFLKKGYKVLIYDNLSAGKKELVHREARFIEEDTLNKEKLQSVLRNFMPSCILHLAAIHFIPYCNSHPDKAINVNIKGTELLLRNIEELKEKPKKVIIASSAAVYKPSNSPHSEEGNEEGPMDIYGVTKLTNETQLKTFHQRTGVDSIAARIFNVYGPRETNPHLIPEIIEQIEQGKTTIELGNLQTKRSFIHVTDLVRGLFELMESPNTDSFGMYNIGSHKEYNAKELVEQINKIIKKKDISCTSRLEKQRKSDRPHLQPDLTKIKKDTKWKEEYDIIKGLKETLQDSGIKI